MNKAGPISSAPSPPANSPRLLHAYTLLIVDEEIGSPWAILLGAENDDDAVALARAHHPTKSRELWLRDRLVAEFD